MRIHHSDTVAVAIVNLPAGEKLEFEGEQLQILQDIPAGHKIALADIKNGAVVVKYGYPIGTAKEDIKRGEHVHTHNLQTTLDSRLDYAYRPKITPMCRRESETFMGYLRQDGSAGVRNEIWIIPTVGCVNGIAKALEKAAQTLVGGGVEAVHAFTHPYGCSQMGEDQENTRKILANLICHPNAGGVLVLGLGCENCGIDTIRPYLRNEDSKRIRFLVCQQVEDEMQAGMTLLSELAAEMAPEKRVPVSSEKLIVGLKCGGSDGFSGITANPVIGAFSDMLISCGGSTILTEVPEMFGAETILMERCKDEETFAKTVDLINDFKAYFEKHGQTIYENPSPGNKEGGISTLEDKALGCTQKSGFAPVTDVLPYGGCVVSPGLNLLSAPGNDLVASTALAAAGAQIVLFSTGRGTPFACPVPTVKISSNSPLTQRKANWIDFDAGKLLDEMNLDKMGRALMDYVLAVASGERVLSEKQGYHDMAIFKNGVTL